VGTPLAPQGLEGGKERAPVGCGRRHRGANGLLGMLQADSSGGAQCATPKNVQLLRLQNSEGNSRRRAGSSPSKGPPAGAEALRSSGTRGGFRTAVPPPARALRGVRGLLRDLSRSPRRLARGEIRSSYAEREGLPTCGHCPPDSQDYSSSPPHDGFTDVRLRSLFRARA
jgi:hypothetical protein